MQESTFVLQLIILSAIFLAYCATETVFPTNYYFLGIKFRSRDNRQWRLGAGIFQLLMAPTLYAWATYHSHMDIRILTGTVIIREDVYVMMIAIAGISVALGTLNVFLGLNNPRRLGHL